MGNAETIRGLNEFNEVALKQPAKPPDEVMLVDVLLLCTECQRPIKARINTPQWIRVEWIGPAGECQSCYAAKREQGEESGR